MLQSLLVLCLVLLFIGLIMFLVNRAPFIDPQAKVVVNYILLVVLVLVAIFGLYSIVGITGPLTTGHLRNCS